MEKYLTPSTTQTSEGSSKPIEEPITDSTPTPSKPSSNPKPPLQPSPSPIPESGKATHVNKRKRKPTKPASMVWEHFTKIKGGDPNDPRCACNYCGKDYACNTKTCGTSSMLVHLNTQCKKYPFRVEDKKQKLLSFQAKTETGSNLVAVGFNKEACRGALAKMIILDKLPFRIVEGEGFRQFCTIVQPRFDPPSRFTVARDVFQLYLAERKKLKGELTRSSQRVCLTTDCWTSLQNINYMCLTAHYIDSE